MLSGGLTGIVIGVILASLGQEVVGNTVSNYWLFYILLPLALMFFMGLGGYLADNNKFVKQQESEVKR